MLFDNKLFDISKNISNISKLKQFDWKDSKLFYTLRIDTMGYTTDIITSMIKFNNVEAKVNDLKYSVCPNPYVTNVNIIRFKKSIIILTSSIQSEKGPHGTEIERPYLEFKTFNTPKNIANVHELTRTILIKSRLLNILNSHKYININNANRESYIPIDKFKSIDDIFITNDNKDKLINSINSFRKKRDWYMRNKIPCHFGILLYGPPGTGKTSIATALAKYIKGYTEVFSGLSELLNARIRINHKREVFERMITIICEDVDRDIEKLNRSDDEKYINTIGSILNYLDGTSSLSDAIYIFTTNNIADLDPAMIRPGRIDLQIEIGYLNFETVNQFMNYHFNRVIEQPIPIRDGLTVAELQVKLMEGCGFEEIVDYVSRGEIVNDRERC